MRGPTSVGPQPGCRRPDIGLPPRRSRWVAVEWFSFVGSHSRRGCHAARWHRSSEREHRAGWVQRSLEACLVRRRDRFLRERIPVVGVGWKFGHSRLAVFGPASSERQPPPWWTCPVTLGSWGSSGRYLRARPLRRRGIAETVRCRSLRVHAPRGYGFSGRLLPAVSISSLRRLCCRGDEVGSGPTVPRVVRSSERSTRLPASICWMCPFPSRVHFVDSVLLRVQLRLYAQLGNPVLRCCSSGWYRGCRLGTVRGSALRGRREVGRTLVLRDACEVSRVFVLRGGHEVSINCPSGWVVGPPTICSSERAGGVTQRRRFFGPGCRSVTVLSVLRDRGSSGRPRVRSGRSQSFGATDCPPGSDLPCSRGPRSAWTLETTVIISWRPRPTGARRQVVDHRTHRGSWTIASDDPLRLGQAL